MAAGTAIPSNAVTIQRNLFNFGWQPTQSPAGAGQWQPVATTPDATTPDAHIPGKRKPPMMKTSDIALRRDPEHARICCRHPDNMDEFADALARARHKLTHRDVATRSW